MEVLFEVMAERHINERPLAGGELHRGGQPALHHGQVAHRQVAVQVVHVAMHLESVGRARWDQRFRIDPRPGHHDHAQSRDEPPGRRERRDHAAQQVRADAGAARGDHADLLTGPVAEIGANGVAVGESSGLEAGHVAGEPEIPLHPVADSRQAGAELVRHHVARVADEHGAVPQCGEAGDLLDHLGVVIGGQGLLPRPAVRHRQPAHEVGHPGVGRALELGVLVQEVVDVPGLVADPQIEGLVFGQLGEDHEVADQDLVHRPDRLEGVQVVLGGLVPKTLDVPGLAGQEGRGRVDQFGASPQQLGDRVLRQPVHLQAGAEPAQFVGDRQVTAGVPEPDGRGDVEHPFGPVQRPRPGTAHRRG